MNKFNVGDRVKIKGGVNSVYLKDGEEYIVDTLAGDKISVVGVKFNYDSHIFELTKESKLKNTNVLTPLQVAEAMLNEDKLQVYDEDTNKWFGFSSKLGDITLEDLKHIKLRHKPKTIIINGVEILAPANLDNIGSNFYVVDIPTEQVHRIGFSFIRCYKHYWATEEDAQQVLDAILIPIKGLNKGDI